MPTRTDVNIVPFDSDSPIRNLLKIQTVGCALVPYKGNYIPSPAPISKIKGPWSKSLNSLNSCLRNSKGFRQWCIQGRRIIYIAVMAFIISHAMYRRIYRLGSIRTEWLCPCTRVQSLRHRSQPWHYVIAWIDILSLCAQSGFTHKSLA